MCIMCYNVTMQKKKMGRPPVANPATEKLPNIRLKPEQLQSYRDASDVNDQSLSDWVRTTLDKAAKRANKD